MMAVVKASCGSWVFVQRAMASTLGVLATPASACSGPGAGAAIERAERVGVLLLGVTFLMAVGAGFLLRRRSNAWRRL